MDINEYRATCSKMNLPFGRTRQVYHRLANWCIVISAGTLLWSIGNFDKFIIKYPDGITGYMPHKTLYITFLVLFIIATIIFTFLRGYVYVSEYYDTRLREIKDISERRSSSKPAGNDFPLSRPEKDLLESIENKYHEEYFKEHSNREKWGQTKWIPELIEQSISRSVSDFGGRGLNILSARVNLLLAIGMFCYLSGLIICIIYVCTFLCYHL